MVPHLKTALAGPINELEQRILESMPAIERWFRLEWMEHTPPFYAAADLRNAGFKLAPVDLELFPATFHHLAPETLPLAVQAAMAAIEKICPEARNLLLLPDAGKLGSSFYRANVQRLVEVFTQAGLNVRLGAVGDAAPGAPQRLPLAEGGELVLEPLLRQRGRVGLKDFDPCTILLNSALAAGTPRELQHLHEQYLLPPLHAGWTLRRKSTHFRSYEEVAKKFAKLLGMDPWLLTPLNAHAGALALDTAPGIEALKAHADALLAKVRRKYKEYGIADKPFVVVKADAAAGKGILAVRDARELDDADRVARARRHCSAGPEAPVELLVQEGVPTHERINDMVAEPVVLMIDRYVVGGFYRAHGAGGDGDDAIGAPGARYVPLSFAGGGQLPRPGARPGASAPNRFYMYGVVGRLGAVAAAYELEATDPEAEQYA